MKLSEAHEQLGPRLGCWDGITVILGDCLYTSISHAKYGFKFNPQALPWHQSTYRLFFHSVSSTPFFFAYPDCAHVRKFGQHLFFFFFFKYTWKPFLQMGSTPHLEVIRNADFYKCISVLWPLTSHVEVSFASLTARHTTTMSRPE